MRLYTYCTNCNHEIRFSSGKPDRVELSRSTGDHIELKCKNCNQTHACHLNKISATEGKTAQIIALIILFIGTPITIYLIWDYIFQFNYIYITAALIALIGIPFMVYRVIEKEQEKKVRQFNSYKIRE